MNLPENLSPAATKVYNLLSSQPTGQTIRQLSEADDGVESPEGYPKAIATANSLVIKEIIRKEKDGEQTVYSLLNQPMKVDPDKEFTGDGYVEGEGETENNDTNAEEQRMVDLLEKNEKKLPESKLFELYEKEQSPASIDETSDSTKKFEAALQELTDAGVVTKDGETYSIKQ